MTCIVGIEHKGRVWLGGDSAGVAGLSITQRADAKVFTNGPFVMGFTSSFRMGQILRWKLEPPAPPEDNDYLECFMSTDFVTAVRTCLADNGWMAKKNEREEGGTFLVGVNGTLFCVESDFQVGLSHDGYMAVGCGDDLALGALHATVGRSPAYRLKAALLAAEHHSAGVSGPFTIEVTK